jgi:transposase
VSAISALALWLAPDGSLGTDVYFRLYPKENVNSRHIRDFLHQVRYQVEGEVSVVWDRASHHRAQRVQRFFKSYERFSRVLLPAYCPELNPDEGVWNWSKTKDLANACPKDLDGLVSGVRGSLRRLQHRPRAQRWCVHDSEFPIESLL